MNGKRRRVKVVRSMVGVVIPAMVFLSGCPDQCAPAGQAEPAAIQAAAAAVRQAATAAQPAAEPAPPAAPAPTVKSTPSTRAAGSPTTRAATAPTSPPLTAPAGSLLFSEDFSNPQAFYDRFDHQFEGDPESGKAWGGNVSEWPGDHSMSCGNPNESSRTIKVKAGDTDQAFYPCTPGGDPAKAHVMTSVNTEGYVIAWFSPKQAFAKVRRVCWDQNIQNLGGGKWTQVLFVTQAEAAKAKGVLGFTSPEFADPTGPSTSVGGGAHGVKLEGGTMTSWSQLGEWNPYAANTVQRPFTGDVGVSDDKAPRYQQCIIDNENGTLTAVRSGPNGTQTSTAKGEIPNEPIRVVFEDDNYNPDKHNNANATDGIARNSGLGYTWHWDNIQISG
jgi:hypothetical protein